MTAAPGVPAAHRDRELSGQTVVVIGGSSGMGLETARRARAEGADLILTGRDAGRLQDAAREVGATRTNTALTGATYDIDGGGQLVSG